MINCIPLKMQKIAAAHKRIPNAKINGYNGFSLFLKELLMITGPINNNGNAPDKN